ncbi:MAG TPA: holin family protein [Pedomonas sp.]|uniref:holin family protein n=1 Tax=Pedomonas sp. TaxID=2976421 RepID=UPI002F407807
MGVMDAIVGPLARVIDKVIPDPEARERAKLELLRLEGSQELEQMKAQLSAIIAEAQAGDPWTSRARPSFLYVMYVLLLFSIPMGLVSAWDREVAGRIAEGMTGYLQAIPEPLYVLFGTGYLGYTAARQWGKAKGGER